MKPSELIKNNMEEIVEKMTECHAQMSEANGGCAYVAIDTDGEVYKGFEQTDNFHLYNDAEIARYKPYSLADCEPTINLETGEELTAEEITALEKYYRDNYDAREHLARIIEDCERAEEFSVTDHE